MKNVNYILLMAALVISYTACKKSANSTDNTITLTPFADSLRIKCTQPFIGAGDLVNIYFPTAFTPNGDGTNDIYAPVSSDLSFSSFLMTIYDTTGKQMFQSGSALYGWDGYDSATGKISTKYKFYVQIDYTTPGNKTEHGNTYLFLLPADSALGCVNRVFTDTSKYEFPDQFDAVAGFNATWPSNEVFCK
jgi:gliding motility-associated-like protein